MNEYPNLEQEIEEARTLGRIEATQTSMYKTLSHIESSIVVSQEKNDEALKELFARIRAIEMKMSTWRTIIRTLRFVGGAIIIVFSWKGVPVLMDHWEQFFKTHP